MAVSTKDTLAFVRAIHAGNFDAAGVFADWLEEQPDPNAPRIAVLLRRRWKRYQKERQAEVDRARQRETEIVAPMRAALASLQAAGWTVEGSIIRASVSPDDRAGLSFRRYIQKQFPLPEFANL